MKARGSSGTKLVHGLWRALQLELPVKRRPQLERFFTGFKPLQPVVYGSLLRAMARALVEAGGICVGRGAPHDPVELIAAALEVGIDQWDRGTHEVWDDVAVRIAAFELLYGVRASIGRVVALARAVESCELGPNAEVIVRAIEQARRAVATTSSSSEYPDAMLAELVIVGRCSREAAALDASRPKALTLACAALLVRAEQFPKALEACRQILDRVPGHKLALQQAARCCFERGALMDAQVYTRRAAGRVEAGRGGS